MDTLNFKSCFIVGVKLNDELAILEDSAHCKYFVKAENKEAMQSFKSWFNNVYIKGTHQFLTVFSYDCIDNDDEGVDMVIAKIFTTSRTTNGEQQ